MGSRSDTASPPALRPRPSADIVSLLRSGKEALRREREEMPLPDKVRQVLELQKVVYPLLVRRRNLEPWERPWEIEP